jgi:hypothetical protein
VNRKNKLRTINGIRPKFAREKADEPLVKVEMINWPHLDLVEAVNFIIKNCRDARWDIVARAMNTLGYSRKKTLFPVSKFSENDNSCQPAQD